MLLYAYQLVLDAGFRKAMKNATAWAEMVYANEYFVKILGKVQLCAKPYNPTFAVEKKVEKKAAPV